MNVALEDRCDEIRATLSRDSIPVNVEAIAGDESIELAPGEYGPGFDGRIEYLPIIKRFAIYYSEADLSVDPRARFTVAHELGHYYIDDHREMLFSGKSHNSTTGFRSDQPMEREADEFAASLLMPRHVMEGYMKQKGFMTLSEIQNMAGRLVVSATAAAIRYARYATEPCAVIMSENERILYCIASDELRARGLGFMKRGQKVPEKAKARELLASARHREMGERATSTDEWYIDRWNTTDLWEESISLGYCGQVITLLSVPKKS